MAIYHVISVFVNDALPTIDSKTFTNEDAAREYFKVVREEHFDEDTDEVLIDEKNEFVAGDEEDMLMANMSIKLIKVETK